MPKPSSNEAVHDLARQAYDFVARHPAHPLAPALRSKAAAALCVPPLTSSLELNLLLESAKSASNSTK